MYIHMCIYMYISIYPGVPKRVLKFCPEKFDRTGHMGERGRHRRDVGDFRKKCTSAEAGGFPQGHKG